MDSPRALLQLLEVNHADVVTAISEPLVNIAINKVQAGWDSPITDGDEIAFLPPVSGG